ncbi:MAG: hypothetical protein WBD47_18520 [Phormidesmis sp.]
MQYAIRLATPDDERLVGALWLSDSLPWAEPQLAPLRVSLPAAQKAAVKDFQASACGAIPFLPAE